VLPGDTLIFKCDLITPIRRGICHMQANAYANGKLVAEAELIIQIASIKFKILLIGVTTKFFITIKKT
jgi:UDP-3-O-[3-hydroxymyristoyl] N-acetylglucosamine deacetylase/3-hydroxyacyl-[acyl-carrier-protein] dehydratase